MCGCVQCSAAPGGDAGLRAQRPKVPSGSSGDVGLRMQCWAVLGGSSGDAGLRAQRQAVYSNTCPLCYRLDCTQTACIYEDFIQARYLGTQQGCLPLGQHLRPGHPRAALRCLGIDVGSGGAHAHCLLFGQAHRQQRQSNVQPAAQLTDLCIQQTHLLQAAGQQCAQVPVAMDKVPAGRVVAGVDAAGPDILPCMVQSSPLLVRRIGETGNGGALLYSVYAPLRICSLIASVRGGTSALPSTAAWHSKYTLASFSARLNIRGGNKAECVGWKHTFPSSHTFPQQPQSHRQRCLLTCATC